MRYSSLHTLLYSTVSQFPNTSTTTKKKKARSYKFLMFSDRHSVQMYGCVSPRNFPAELQTEIFWWWEEAAMPQTVLIPTADGKRVCYGAALKLMDLKLKALNCPKFVITQEIALVLTGPDRLRNQNWWVQLNDHKEWKNMKNYRENWKKKNEATTIQIYYRRHPANVIYLCTYFWTCFICG